MLAHTCHIDTCSNIGCGTASVLSSPESGNKTVANIYSIKTVLEISGTHLARRVKSQIRVLMRREIKWTRGQTDVLESWFPTPTVEQDPVEFETRSVQVQKVLRVQVGKDLEEG